MQSLTCLVSMRDDVENPETWYSNGYSQNIKFFYELLELMGHYPIFLFGKDYLPCRFPLMGREYRGMSINQVLEEKIHVDIAFEVGVTINEDVRQVLRQRYGSKIVAVRYGIALVMDMEQLVHNETMTPGIHVAGADAVWTSPHIGYGIQYLQTILRCPGRIAPYLWEPHFITRSFKDTDIPERMDIYVMEPNLSVIKNALIPIAVIEEVWRQAPEAFGKACVLNGLNFYNRTYFLENIVRYMESVRAETNKVFFLARYRFDDVFQRPDVLLGHQWGCDLNYLYLEALHIGLPFVHNSEALQEVGYYYPGFDVQAGRDRCLEALSGHSIERSAEANRKLLFRYSIHNPEVQAEYARLIAEVMEG